MTAIEAQKFMNSISYLTDNAGKKVAVQIDLKNANTRQIFQDLLDTLTIIERQEERGRDFDEFVREYLSESNS